MECQFNHLNSTKNRITKIHFQGSRLLLELYALKMISKNDKTPKINIYQSSI